jgi:copper resistance protein C
LIRAGRTLLAAGLLLAAAGATHAHSLLLESVPAAGATLTAPPPQLTLRFNNRIEKSLSRVRLVNGQGVEHLLAVAVGSESADRLTAAVPSLPPGLWRVEWQVLSTDGHVVYGRFTFTLSP